jgi:hypothetical protein
MRVDIRPLGRFRVAVDGRPVSGEVWRRPPATALVPRPTLPFPHGRSREQAVRPTLSGPPT